MPFQEAPIVELGSIPETSSTIASPSPSEVSSSSSAEPQNVRATPLFRVLAAHLPEPDQLPGQEELERRLPGYRRIVIPRELTLIELLKEACNVQADDDVLRIREARLRVVAERVGLRRLDVLTPYLRSLTLDGSALSSLRELGTGLKRLKFLSVNRCGLTSLDGVWGVAGLRELEATGNKIVDLQPVSVLQKLQALDLTDNPITQSSRVWTLGVCSSLRRLRLSGSPLCNTENYWSSVVESLPMLMYLDGRPVRDDEMEILETMSSESEAEVEVHETEREDLHSLNDEPQPSTSGTNMMDHIPGPSGDEIKLPDTFEELLQDRPATTDCVRTRVRISQPRRPNTASGRYYSPVVTPLTKLEIMNTLFDNEWICSGSSLTSHTEAMCGNLAQALRRSKSRQKIFGNAARQEPNGALADVSRILAAEIPRVPRLEEWERFRQETGIDINIDFNERPAPTDATKAIERLEQIERETAERIRAEIEEKNKNKI